jgi:hypothetical protein
MENISFVFTVVAPKLFGKITSGMQGEMVENHCVKLLNYSQGKVFFNYLVV